MRWRRLLLGWMRWAGDGDEEMERTGGGGHGVVASLARCILLQKLRKQAGPDIKTAL